VVAGGSHNQTGKRAASIASANTDAAFVFDSLGRLIEEGQTYG